MNAKAITRGWKKFVAVTSTDVLAEVLKYLWFGLVDKFKFPPGGDVCKIHPLNGLLVPLRKKIPLT